MKPALRYIFVAISTAMLIACSGKDKPSSGEGDSDSSASLWKMKNYPVSKVEVYTGDDKLLETFEYTYDKAGKVLTLVRKDCLKAKTLLDLKYSYSGKYDMELSGTYYFTTSAKSMKASIDEANTMVSYQGDWVNAWPFVTKFDKDGVIKSTTVDTEFTKSEYYSSTTSYSETYTVSSGNVTSAVLSTDIQTASARATKATSAAAVKINYTYSDKEDNQNFGVYLFNCEFPLWYAKELPGCRNLITGMTVDCGGVKSPLSFKVSYDLNADGDIETATRTDYNGDEVVLVRKYKFTYL